MNRSSTSPFKVTNVGRTQVANTPESLELLIQSLERQNNNLVEEINILKNRSRRVNQLEDKIDLVLKHNTQLLNENEKLAKLINQKKSQVQVWKNKYQTLTVNRNASSELQSRKLINEIEKLKEEITDIEHMKNMQISELKNQNHLDIQNIKRTHLGNNQKYQLEIRKLKQYCQKKQYQISDLNMKLVRLSKETDFQIAKLRQEKQRLRSDLHYEEIQHRKEVESLKNKFDFNFHSEIQNLKKQHLNQVQALDYENTKLKEVINSKNMQIQQILTKNLKVKNNYEDSIDLLKKQIEDLKEKIIETQNISELQLNNLRQKLQGMKQSELTLLKNSHSNQMDLLNRQILKLQQIIENRNNDLETISKERNQMRINMETEIIKAKTDLQTQINQNKDQEIRHGEALKVCDYDLKCKNEELKIIQSYLKDQIDTLKKERDSFNSLVQHKTEQLSRERNEAAITTKKLENQLQVTKEKVFNLKDEIERDIKKSSNQTADLKKTYDLKVKQLQSHINNLIEENNQKDRFIKELEGIIEVKNTEIKVSDDKIEILEQTEKDLRKQMMDANARWKAKESQYTFMLKSQTDSLEKTRLNEIYQLKNIHNNKVYSLNHRIQQLERQIEDKNRVLNDLSQKYEELVSKFKEIFSQRAAQKNLDIKVPGWLPDTLALKSLFDVFLKNKVLEYCS